MKPTSQNEISVELANSFNGEMTFELAKRLENKHYIKTFDGLKNWHLLRGPATNRPVLISNYRHVLDQEPFDEN